MKRVPGPVHAVAVTLWRKSRARRWTTALPTAQGYGQPLRGSAVAHRLPTSFAFGLTRRCASCPNDTHHRSFPRHRYSHRYTLPIYDGSTRFALPIPGCFRLIPELEKTTAPVSAMARHRARVVQPRWPTSTAGTGIPQSLWATPDAFRYSRGRRALRCQGASQYALARIQARQPAQH